VHQWAATPPVSFSGRIVDSIEFYERRTSTFTAGVLLEASVGSDTLFTVRLTDTLYLTTGNNGAYLRRTAPLPDSFSGKENIRFRWRSVGNPSGGGTAVLRIEDVRITVRRVTDLGLSTFRSLNATPREGDDVTLIISVVNRAMAGTFTGSIELVDSVRHIMTVPFDQTLAAQDSVTIALTIPSIRAGRHAYTARLTLAGDEDTLNNSIGMVMTAGMRSSSVLINEFMYTPAAGMPEWVELVNPGDDTLALAGWRLSDAGSTKALLSGNGSIDPQGYGIVTTDTNTFRSFFDIAVPLFQASFSALNNSGDAVVLYDRYGAMIDSLSYRSTWGGGTGRSLERIDTAFRSADSATWSASRHPEGSTPGEVNSVTRKRTDAALRSLHIAPVLPVTGAPAVITVTVFNAGREMLTGASVRLLLNGTVSGERSIADLASGDSSSLEFLVNGLKQREYRCAAVIGAAGDGDASNDTLAMEFTVGVPAASVIVTEVMSAPPEGMPEWIELYNRASTPIDLAGWTIADNGSTNAPLGTAPMTVAAGSYIIITTDPLQFFASYPAMPETVLVIAAAVPSLNNTTPDAVVLRDGTRRTMDSLRYQPQWLVQPGHSLQRYDRDDLTSDSLNWRSDLPSPGTENPSGRKEQDAGFRSFTAERSGDVLRLHATVTNHGRSMMENVVVRFFYDADKDSLPASDEAIASFPLPSLAPLDSSSARFDWNLTRPGLGRFFARIDHDADQQPLNDIAVTSSSLRFPVRTMIINEILYEPRTNNSEFVELLNRSADTVDIDGWKLMDQPSSSGSRTEITLSRAPSRILPGEFVLIASDSSIYSELPPNLDSLVLFAPSLSLSNSGEELVLADLTGAVIDSVRYSPEWHLRTLSTAGRSLERIDPNGRSEEPRNWSSSVSPLLSTPLKQNSIELRTMVTSSALSLQPNPFSPDQDGHEDFLSIGYSLPGSSVTIRLRIYDVSGRLIRTLAQNEPSAPVGSLNWDGRDDQGHRVRIGPYIILLEALDNLGGTAAAMKGVVVAARKLR
ncbi:MAG: lamin tail domain-containing protein, partial [Bacteroidetes bacterium]|nr:lamin tail domain-containing protein [Bacteroidota bacterium]